MHDDIQKMRFIFLEKQYSFILLESWIIKIYFYRLSDSVFLEAFPVHLRFDLIPRLLGLFRRITRFGFFATPHDVTVLCVCTIYRDSSWFGSPSKADASRSLFSAI